MKPSKILYVDDEAMALKYFERLASSVAPVLTAISVEEGKKQLVAHGSEIAVLITDQRMPGAYGNELLRYARENHPSMVRMLTTAYSELGEAIVAINAGEIYRYITKPWEVESLKADLKNAMELADLRFQRDDLLQEKRLSQHAQWLAARVSQLALTCRLTQSSSIDLAFHQYLQSAKALGGAKLLLDWNSMDVADMMQFEADRQSKVSHQIKALITNWCTEVGATPTPEQSLQVLSKAFSVPVNNGACVIPQRQSIALLEHASKAEVEPARCAWLAWLLWSGQHVNTSANDEGLQVQIAAQPMPALAYDWMADDIEQITGF